jgi:hypothetical protein
MRLPLAFAYLIFFDIASVGRYLRNKDKFRAAGYTGLQCEKSGIPPMIFYYEHPVMA